MKKRSVGLALGAAGARGLAHIGVLRVFERRKVPIHYLAGTSIGALIGALYAAWGDSHKIEEFVLKHCGIRGWLSLVDPSLRGGLLAGKKIELFLNATLGTIRFEDLHIPLAVIATDLSNGQEVIFQKGSVVKAVRASIAAAPVFEPVRIGRHWVGDGALVNPVPDDVVRQMGAERVIAVSLDSGFRLRPLLHPRLADMVYRSLSIIRYHYSRRTTKVADLIIQPRIRTEMLVAFNDFFDSRKVEEYIKVGKRETMRRWPEIRKMLE